jgi:SagB-type dehydrogenase family enzyme
VILPGLSCDQEKAVWILNIIILNKATRYSFITAVVILSGTMGFTSSQAEGMFRTMQVNNQGTVRLPQPVQDSDTSIEEALRRRRSVRTYKDNPLTLAEVSQLLWAAQGITRTTGFRTAPSAGALYPLEIYIAAGNVEDLPAGIYHYKPHEHELVRVLKGDRRTELCNAALGQTSVKNAPAVIVFSAVYGRTTVKYGDRGIQYVHIEAGHAAQNVFLQAVSLNLGAVVIGAFNDEAVKDVLKMSRRDYPLYIMPVGKLK